MFHVRCVCVSIATSLSSRQKGDSHPNEWKIHASLRLFHAVVPVCVVLFVSVVSHSICCVAVPFLLFGPDSVDSFLLSTGAKGGESHSFRGPLRFCGFLWADAAPSLCILHSSCLLFLVSVVPLFRLLFAPEILFLKYVNTCLNFLNTLVLN